MSRRWCEEEFCRGKRGGVIKSEEARVGGGGGEGREGGEGGGGEGGGGEEEDLPIVFVYDEGDRGVAIIISAQHILFFIKDCPITRDNPLYF